ncbi:MAG: hypothetical protein LBI95_02265 [Holosporales bacterium]|jgi:myosin heavy subunit|nr:hypothetical protein [Holosporales bacterium]
MFICMVFTSPGLPAFSGEDPDIKKLKEADENLQSEIATIKNINENLEAETQSLKNTIKEMKSKLEETEDSFEKKLDTIDKKLGSNEEEMEQLNSLQEKVAKIEEGTRAPESNEQIEQLTQKLDKLETDIQAISANEDSDEELKNIKESLNSVTQQLENQKNFDEQQNIESAKSSARLDKLERTNGAAVIGAAGASVGGLLGSVVKEGFGILSQKLEVDSIKEQLLNGNSTITLSENMTKEEKKELEEIESDIRNGKSDQEIQAKLDILKDEIENREKLQSRFQRATFYGVNQSFKDESIIIHLLNQARLGHKIPPETILTGNINSVDVDLINTIYEMGVQNATIFDIYDAIKLIFTGSPKKIIVKQPDKSTIAQQSANGAVVQEGGTIAPGSASEASVQGGAVPQASSVQPVVQQSTSGAVVQAGGTIVPGSAEASVQGGAIPQASSVQPVVQQSTSGAVVQAGGTIAPGSASTLQKPVKNGKTPEQRQAISKSDSNIALEKRRLDMTVMDVKDNRYYDVERQKFEQIAQSSKRYPETKVVPPTNMEVRPIDQASSANLNLLSKD